MTAHLSRSLLPNPMLARVYRSLTTIGAPFIEAFLYVRMHKGKEDAERFSERFGYASKRRPKGRVVWCHAASVGEAASLLLLLDCLHEIYSDLSVVLTTGTVTAARMVQKRLPVYAVHQYVPIDLVPAVRRFLDTWKPMLAIWVESELWPNTLAALRERGVPALLLNARMSERSFRNWYRVRSLAAGLVSGFRLCLAQTEADKARFIALGAKPVKCVGNLKYVAAPLPFDARELNQLREETKDRPVWLAASTHPGEEEIVLTEHETLRINHPKVLTVIAPRHPSRGDAVEKLIKARNLKCARRSRGERITPETQVYLADTVGEMGLLYAFSPIALLGGTFANTGGHNPIEPAHLGSAIVFGPSMFNFSEIAREFVGGGGARQIQHADEISLWVDRLWKDTVLRDAQVEAAKLLADQKRIILNNVILEMDPWLRMSA